MRSIPILIMALIIAVVVPHVCAGNVTYPQEYYQYKHEADRWSYTLNEGAFAYVNPSVASDYRTGAILIALEKQNELINEQNELLKKMMNHETNNSCVVYTYTTPSDWTYPSGVIDNINYDIMPISSI